MSCHVTRPSYLKDAQQLNTLIHSCYISSVQKPTVYIILVNVDLNYFSGGRIWFGIEVKCPFTSEDRLVQ